MSSRAPYWTSLLYFLARSTHVFVVSAPEVRKATQRSSRMQSTAHSSVVTFSLVPIVCMCMPGMLVLIGWAKRSKMLSGQGTTVVTVLDCVVVAVKVGVEDAVVLAVAVAVDVREDAAEADSVVLRVEDGVEVKVVVVVAVVVKVVVAVVVWVLAGVADAVDVSVEVAEVVGHLPGVPSLLYKHCARQVLMTLMAPCTHTGLSSLLHT